MPELPEVETIKTDLEKRIVDRPIKSVDILGNKQVVGDKVKFKKRVKNHKIIEVRRRAKMLIFDLDNDYHLISHLKMTGQWILIDNDKVAGGGHPIGHSLKNLPDKTTRLILGFDDGERLFFNDTRGFGWVKLVDSNELEKIENKYGPEPDSKDFNLEYLKQKIKTRKVAIKPLLLEQNLIAGIGNIYASEICFCAGIDPRRQGCDLSDEELKKIIECTRKILDIAIEKRGTSSRDYVDAFGRQGSMNDFLKVYQKEGEDCPRCDGVIKKIVQRQRSTFFCEECQG